MMNKVVKAERDEFIITVGGVDADISGFNSKGIQMALDAVNSKGGGIVKLGEGVFDIAAPVRLYDNVTLAGTGEKTVLRKIDGVKAHLVQDADYGELMATVDDGSGFRPGMGIQVYDSSSSSWTVSTAVITAVRGNTLHFDAHLQKDYEFDLDGIVSNACSIIEGIGVNGAVVKDLCIDGNGNSNDFINGCRGGAVYLHKSISCCVENVRISGFNGDGISWQITEDITVRGCEVHGCSNYGLHPGTGTLRTLVEGCDIHDNASDGLFVCWRVQKGIFRSNKFRSNGFNGINIGHKDTDNLFDSNHIGGNEFCGIYLRPEKDSNGAHRNIYRGNIIENNGNDREGYGVLIDSYTVDNRFEDNILQDTGSHVQKIGICTRQRTVGLKLSQNTMSGHETGDIVGKST